jgi:hypothetical protein
MSTVTGTANFAQERFSNDLKQYISMIIGSINIIAGIITTIQQYLKINEFTESHRISSISWDKFYRNIRVELARSPEERMAVSHMLKICTQEYDRLMETSPSIKEEVISDFKNTFLDTSIDKSIFCCKKKKIILSYDEIMRRRKAYNEINKPDICDSLISTSNFKYTENKNKIIKKQDESELKKNEIIFNNFKNGFFNIHNRYPIESEYRNNLEHIRIDILNLLIKKDLVN